MKSRRGNQIPTPLPRPGVVPGILNFLVPPPSLFLFRLKESKDHLFTHLQSVSSLSLDHTAPLNFIKHQSPRSCCFPAIPWKLFQNHNIYTLHCPGNNTGNKFYLIDIFCPASKISPFHCSANTRLGFKSKKMKDVRPQSTEINS